MKTMKTLMAAASVLAVVLTHAQGYGEAALLHNNSYVTSAQITASQGYLVAGYLPTPSGIQPDFVIDKTDNMANFGSPGDFSQEYLMFDDVNCNAPVRVFGCGGVSVVETFSLPNERYAVAGVYDQGVFFALLDAAGNPSGRYYRWVFPTTAFSYKRPRIRESSVPGEFFICGFVNNNSYAMRINANMAAPTPVWDNYYMNPNGLNLLARDLVQSPFNTNELMIVGRIDMNSAGTAADAFFMSLDANTGTVNYLLNYDKQLTGDEWFSSIEVSNHPTSPGFILGGRSQFPLFPNGPTNANYTQWMAKLDPNGNVTWSSLVWPNGTPSTGFAGREICDVFERANPNPPFNYEYYGVCQTNWVANNPNPQNSLTVYKLDQAGGASLSPDQFHFTNGSSASLSIYDDAQITYIENGSAQDGLQAYGTDVAANSYHYFAKSYFNGVDGCSDTADILRIYPGPTLVGNVSPIGVNPMQSPCPNNFYLQTGGSTNINMICPFATMVPGGSNARLIATGISKNGKNGTELYPNPVSDKALVSYPSDVPVKIEIFNTMGQKINVPVREVEEGKAELDFAGGAISNGIYFIHLSTDQETHQVKVIYTRE